ncbi:hypothetical protein BDK51DRAFT_30430 [Blyttiomyces helicus]|uniref:Tyrosinase copper-binding domain-containing protein n=1 Tax=Blyttiomyces helicus TaxID=388810 RepID=A0A4V1IRJ7_9FUNG|nr:hypothetical protein BDK51DRAFT_30430 [Blyttiomyces helicus]|eukprot:RKO90297.1 hypothetical protein BDK51DRAFT_30430 [Blyttiomyces helicus]
MTSLTDSHLTALANLAANGGLANLTIWEQIAFLHHTAGDIIHGNNIFLLFHRKFTAWVEGLLMEANPDFKGLFYWATHAESNPHQWGPDPIWDHLGKAPGFGSIIGGPLENITFPIVPGHSDDSIVRTYNLSDTASLPPFVSAEVYAMAFHDFAGQGFGLGFNGGWAQFIQLLHFNFHDVQGGQMGTFWSPIDFLFWLHHSNIDHIYHEIQGTWHVMNMPQDKQICGNSYLNVSSESFSAELQLNPSPPHPNHSTNNLNLTTPIPYFWEETVDDVQFSAQFCVQYAPAVKGPPPVPQPSTSPAPAKRFTNLSASVWNKLFANRTPKERADAEAEFGDIVARANEKIDVKITKSVPQARRRRGSSSV